MKSILFVLVGSFLFFSNLEAVEIQKKHRQCKTDSNCILIGRGGCCEQDAAINKIYKNKLETPPAKRCADEFHMCQKMRAVCKDQVCSIKEK